MVVTAKRPARGGGSHPNPTRTHLRAVVGTAAGGEGKWRGVEAWRHGSDVGVGGGCYGDTAWRLPWRPGRMAARGGAWVWGSGRSEWGKYFWYWPEKSPEKFSGGRRRLRRWPAAGLWWWLAGFGERRPAAIRTEIFTYEYEMNDN
ncbi:hypothetical protein Tco_1108303 [Tanacetum coccineum]